MSARDNATPVIIKRKKVIASEAHHGGAWKVAYADFVTAMMAFFMLMWLLNATTEQQRKGIADYFSPTIPLVRMSGGGDGSFGGTSVFSEQTLPQNGTGATSLRPTTQAQAAGLAGQDGHDEVLATLEAELLGRGGESSVLDNALQHIVTRVTDEGLIIEIFSRPDSLIFDPETGEPTALLAAIAAIVADVAGTVLNPMAIEAHVPSRPIVLADRDLWRESSVKAERMRALLEGAGTRADRISRLTGHADREPATRDPMSIRNSRVEIILLR